MAEKGMEKDKARTALFSIRTAPKLPGDIVGDEAAAYMARTLVPQERDDASEENSTVFALKPGERRGWWTAQDLDRETNLIAMVRGAVCNHRVNILLDSGSSVSLLSSDLARRLDLEQTHDQKLRINGIGGTVTYVTARTHIKITLGLQVVYFTDIWVGNIGEDLDCLLGTDFMRAAGVRLSIADGSLRLPDEEHIPLLKDFHTPETFNCEIPVCVSEPVMLESGEAVRVPVKYGTQDPANFELWLYRTDQWVTALEGVSERSWKVRVVNISTRVAHLHHRTTIASLVQKGGCPAWKRCVRIGTPRYAEWQALIYEATQSRKYQQKQLLKDSECDASVKPLVLRPTYPVPTGFLKRQRSTSGCDTSGTSKEPSPFDDVDYPASKHSSSDFLSMNPPREMDARVCAFVCSTPQEVEDVALEQAAEVYYHEGTDLTAEDLKNQLALVPELEDWDVKADISTADIGEEGETTPEEVQQLRDVLETHRTIFLGHGNALPPPARGIVCDIDVGDNKPIAQRSRRIPPHLLEKVFELIKRLLEAGLIEFSDSDWASPIVIVMKKNGVDIRLCIDYRLVNSLTKLMNYPLPLIDDLLDNFDAYMWFVSMDMASGFWAILMTPRAKAISAFICPLGHFQWVRMPFGLKNAPLIYQMMLDNCLWGFVRLPPDLEREVEPEVLEHLGLAVSEPNASVAIASDSSVEEAESSEGALVDPRRTVFTENISAPKSMRPVLGRRSYIDDVAFGAVKWSELCARLNELLYRLRYFRISVSLPKSLFGKRKIPYLSHDVDRVGITATPKIAKELDSLQFPTTLKGIQSFLGSLNYYHKFIEGFPVIATVLYELTDEQLRSGQDLDKAKHAFDLLKQKLTSAPLLRHPDRSRPFSVVLYVNDWAISATVCQEHEGKLHPVRYIGRTLNASEVRYHAAEKEVLALLRVLNNCFPFLAGQPLKVYTRFSTLKWIYTSKTLQGRALQWAVMLSPWTLEICKMQGGQDGLAALLAASISPPDAMDILAADLVPKKAFLPSPLVCMEQLEDNYDGYLLSFDGAAKLKTNVGSAGIVLWKLPEWTIVTAQGFHLENVTVNEAEYYGMLQGLRVALELNISELVVVGDSRIAIQQVLEYIDCHKPHLQLLLAKAQELKASFAKAQFLHVKREYNSAADYIATKTLRQGYSAPIDDADELEQLRQLNRLPERILPREAPPSRQVAVTAEGVTLMVQSRGLSSVFDRAVASSMPSTLSRGGGDFKSDFQSQPAPQNPVVSMDSVYVTTRSAAVAQNSDVPEQSVPVEQTTSQPNAAHARRESSKRRRGQERQRSQQGVQTRAALMESVPEGSETQERMRRIAVHQDADSALLRLKRYLKGDFATFSQEEMETCKKDSTPYVLKDDVLFYTSYLPRHRGSQPELTLRLVVPSDLVQDLLRMAHSEFQGAHQGIMRSYDRLRTEFYWRNMFSDVERYVKNCEDCSTCKGKPMNPGTSPGNIVAEYPFHVVSMDFVGPFPESNNGNKWLLLFQCMFSGFIMCKPMRSTTAEEVAAAYEECVFRRFGASSFIRHDRDPRFMSEVFGLFREMIGSRQRATLSYRPQANGQQERSVQTVVRAIRAFCADPGQRDWDELVVKLLWALNTCYDSTRKDTPFFLVHGWDARNTVSAMMSRTVPKGARADPYLWRLKVQRQAEYAIAWARSLQEQAKKARADRHNAQLDSLPEGVPKQYEIGESVWLYVSQVKPGLSKKLAHVWHGPFRIIDKSENESYRYRLKLEGTSYRFYPWVHISRLKPRIEFPNRPQDAVAELPEDDDFDAALLPEDSWVPDEETGRYEVQAIHDVRWSRGTRNSRKTKEYLVEWKGYEQRDWVPVQNLNCGQLLFEFDRSVVAQNRFQAMVMGDDPEGRL